MSIISREDVCDVHILLDGYSKAQVRVSVIFCGYVWILYSVCTFCEKRVSMMMQKLEESSLYHGKSPFVSNNARSAGFGCTADAGAFRTTCLNRHFREDQMQLS